MMCSNPNECAIEHCACIEESYTEYPARVELVFSMGEFITWLVCVSFLVGVLSAGAAYSKIRSDQYKVCATGVNFTITGYSGVYGCMRVFK